MTAFWEKVVWAVIAVGVYVLSALPFASAVASPLQVLAGTLIGAATLPSVNERRQKAEEKRRSSLPPGTIVGIVLLVALLAGCAEPTAAGALCRTRANGKWALVAEQRCPDTPAPAEQDWDQCPHRQAILDGLSADLERCPL